MKSHSLRKLLKIFLLLSILMNYQSFVYMRCYINNVTQTKTLSFPLYKNEIVHVKLSQ